MNPIVCIKCRAAITLGQILQVRNLRNTSCQFMTNHRRKIGVIGQIIWYFRHYRLANRLGNYRVYLFYNDRNKLIGYGALHLKDALLYVTECVKPALRGQGYGKAILKKLIGIAQKNSFSLAADIWADNKPSAIMHEKMGFKLIQTSTHNDRELNAYSLKII